MQIAQQGTAATNASAGGVSEPGSPAQRSPYADYKIIRRNGAVVGFEPAKISIAMTKAFLAVNGGQGAASARVREQVAELTDSVVNALMRRQPAGGTFHIEDIQDQVELALMRSGEHDVARAYVLYREERAQERARAGEGGAGSARRRAAAARGRERRNAGRSTCAALHALVAGGLRGPGPRRQPAADPARATLRDLYDGVPMDEVRKSLILAARALIEKDPAYSYVTARLLLHTIRLEMLGEEVTAGARWRRVTPSYFPQFIAARHRRRAARRARWPTST